MRTHLCGALTPGQVGERVTLCGWVHKRRDLGGLIFLDLRDREGIVQAALGPDWATPAVMDAASRTVLESVVRVTGIVAERPPEARNPDMNTGAIEVHAENLEHLSTPRELPIPVWRTKGEQLPEEELRLQHRHLDLRRPELQEKLVLRHRLLQRARLVLSELGFLELETPILTRPTPEGARDYLVPSRVHRGRFYALPQSPQIYKQLLMVSGFDRYFQIARCFRDEDLRADRQPEFTQIDLEASFVSEDDVMRSVESCMAALWEEAGHGVSAPFERLRYGDAMEWYGSDKPDLRYSKLRIRDLGALLGGRGFRAFDGAAERGERVRGFVLPDGGAVSRKQLEELVELARKAGLGGLAYARRRGEEVSGPLAKLEGANPDSLELPDGGLLLAGAGPDRATSAAFSAVRDRVIRLLDLPPEAAHVFAWVVEFPLCEPDDHTGELTFAHHPFTSPHPDDMERFAAGHLEGTRARHYDLVYNGTELGSGSIRIHDAELQLAVLAALGVPRAEAETRFGFLLRALRSGAPPHGGFAVGFDRVAMLLAGGSSLREVIAFPKTTAARALFEDTPAEVGPQDLAELGMRLV